MPFHSVCCLLNVAALMKVRVQSQESAKEGTKNMPTNIEAVFQHEVVRHKWAVDIRRNEPAVLQTLSDICREHQLDVHAVIEYFFNIPSEDIDEDIEYEMVRMLYGVDRDPVAAALKWLDIGYSRQAQRIAEFIADPQRRAKAMLFIEGKRDKEREKYATEDTLDADIG